MWLTNPATPLVLDEVTLMMDYMVDTAGRLALSIHEAHLWSLSPSDEERFTSRV